MVHPIEVLYSTFRAVDELQLPAAMSYGPLAAGAWALLQVIKTMRSWLGRQSAGKSLTTTARATAHGVRDARTSGEAAGASIPPRQVSWQRQPDDSQVHSHGSGYQWWVL